MGPLRWGKNGKVELMANSWYRGEQQVQRRCPGEAFLWRVHPELFLGIHRKGANDDIEIKSQDDLLPQGAQPGTIASDLEQATGLERVEILGKMEGIDIFDMRPLDSSRTGKEDPPAHATYILEMRPK